MPRHIMSHPEMLRQVPWLYCPPRGCSQLCRRSDELFSTDCLCCWEVFAGELHAEVARQINERNAERDPDAWKPKRARSYAKPATRGSA